MPRLTRTILQRKPTPRPPTQPQVSRTPVKYYLGIGINYVGTPNELRGCINDITNSSNYFKNKFPDLQCSFITDDTVTKPTRENILNELIRIFSISQSGDSIILHYSGHGTYTRDTNNDEKDGRDECIVPIDLQVITDDELHDILVAHVKSNVFVLGLFDSCFSGSVLDLQYAIQNNSIQINNNKPQPNGKVILISGCADNQTSADAYINNRFCGAMTWAFLNCYPSSSGWVSLVQNMKILLRNNQFSQIPILSYNTNCDGALL